MTDKAKQEDVPLLEDIFWRNDLYPDAKGLLGFKHLPIDKIKDEAVVVLDANVLLQPYEVDSKELVKEIERVYELLASEGRLIVPGQAVREYVTNRPKKISVVVRRIEAAIENLKKTPLEKIPFLENEAPFVEVRANIDKARSHNKEAIALLEKAASRIRNDTAGDRISNLYRSVLSECVYDQPYSSENRDTIVSDLKRRQRLKVGPGFMDSHKDDLGIGDLLIWRDILAQGSARKTHCLFVSQETKPDWWAPDGGKFQLRPELIDEYRQASEGHSVHMVPLSALLSLFDANPTTVSEVVTAEERDQKKDEEQEQRRNYEWHTKVRSGSLGRGIVNGEERIATLTAYIEVLKSSRAQASKTYMNKEETWSQRTKSRELCRTLDARIETAQREIISLQESVAEMLYSASYEALDDE